MDTTAASTQPTASTQPAAPLKVAVILGSNRDGRFGPVVADWFLARAAGHPGIETDLIDVAEADLPARITFSPGPEEAERLAAVSERLAAADAFVVLTPEYNHSFPAPLKTLIDWHNAEWRGQTRRLRVVRRHLRRAARRRTAPAGLRRAAHRHRPRHRVLPQRGRPLRRRRAPPGPGPADAAAKVLLDQVVWWGTALRDARNARPYGA